MIAYFDTSSVLPLLVEEAGSERAGQLWDAADKVFSSRLVYVEARAALAAAARTGRLRAAAVDDLRSRFEVLHGQMAVVEVGFALFRRAGQLAETRAAGLRRRAPRLCGRPAGR